MKTTQKQAATRLFKKLSALRATLSNEERAILDSLIVTEDVKAHKMTQKISPKTQPKADPKADPKLIEVQGHKMTQKISPKTQPKTTPRIVFDPNSEEYKIQD